MYQEGRGGFSPHRRFVPVKVGDEIDVTIEAVGQKGDGIAKKEGFVLFVPNAKEGQRVKVRVTKVFRKVGFADIVGEAGASVAPRQATAQEEPADDYGSEEEPEAEDSEDFGEESESEPIEEESDDFSEESDDTSADEDDDFK